MATATLPASFAFWMKDCAEARHWTTLTDLVRTRRAKRKTSGVSSLFFGHERRARHRKAAADDDAVVANLGKVGVRARSGWEAPSIGPPILLGKGRRRATATPTPRRKARVPWVSLWAD